MLITVYSKKRCVQCDATKRKLTQLGLEWQEVNLDEDESALELVKDMGHLGAPVVVVDQAHPTMGGENWSGYNPDKLSAL